MSHHPLPLAVAGAQYVGHKGPVTGLCLLPGAGQLLVVASCDGSGAVHVWGAATGALALRFAEPGSAAASAALPLPLRPRARTPAPGALPSYALSPHSIHMHCLPPCNQQPDFKAPADTA